MGNVISDLFSGTCGVILSRCLDCTARNASYVGDLQVNESALKVQLQKLIEARDDVKRRVVRAEQQQMRPLNTVQGWLSRVEAEETEVGELLTKTSREIEKLCLGGYCSKNCKSSYKVGKKVAEKLQTLASLKGEGAFEVVAERAAEDPADDLEVNVKALKVELQKLIEAMDDVKRRVVIAEQQQMQGLNTVQGWLSRVEAEETEVGELLSESSQEIEKLRLGGHCSENCKSSYKVGKKVAEKLQTLAALKGEGAFEVVAEKAPANPGDELPIDPTIVGLQFTFDKVWRCLVEEQVGVIGLYGIGGVGKTTLLKQINNNFCNQNHDFDVVIWSTISKEPKFERIQEDIGKKIGLFNESWQKRRQQEKAQDIFKVLSKKRFVLLFDDLWDEVDLIEIGVPPRNLKNASKLVFTTRDYEVCGKMEAHESFKVECLRHDDAWKLFEAKVGRGVLDSHSDIFEQAKIIVEECAGLPLALITIGRAMASKKSLQEWKHASDVLKKAASKFSGMEEKVYSRLKFSYDKLPSDTIRSCLLYCSLYSEDFKILRRGLIDCWIGEGILDESDGSELYNQGYYIIGVLVHACLLEEEEELGGGGYFVKLHDVIRDMVLWIANKIEKGKENYLVQAGMGLTEPPEVEKWEGVRKISLMENKIDCLSHTPNCFSLQTLFLNYNNLKNITNGFFQFMPSLIVLNLERNISLSKLPCEISKLVSLQYLNLSYTSIRELPIELKGLGNLKYLGLTHTKYLRTIPYQLISNLSRLRVLRMVGCGALAYNEATENSVLFGGGELLVEELLGLKYLNVLTITLRSSPAIQKFFSSVMLQRFTRFLSLEGLEDSKSLVISSSSNLSDLDTLQIYKCEYLEDLKIGDVKKTQEPYGFRSLREVNIGYCSEFRELTWLVFIPNLKSLAINDCDEMVEIISIEKLGEVLEMTTNRSPFAKLQYLKLDSLPNLKSIYWEALPFPHLGAIQVMECPKLTKLPLHSNSAKERKIVIKGEEEWWKELQWEDEATHNTFLPCFKSWDINKNENYRSYIL